MAQIHKINGKSLATPIDYPDDMPPEQVHAIVDAYVQAQHDQAPTSSNLKAFGNKALDMGGRAVKAVTGAAENIGRGIGTEALDPIYRGFKAMGLVPQDTTFENMRDNPNKGMLEKGGNIGVDVLQTLIPAERGAALGAKVTATAAPIVKGLATGLGAGAGSAAVHQAKNVMEGKGVEPGSGLLEMSLSGGMGGAGAGLGQVAEKAGPWLLEHAVDPAKKLLTQINPPSKEGYKLALEKGLIPKQLGFKGANKPISNALSEMNVTRGDLAEQSGQMVNLSAATRSSKGGITSDLGTMKGGLMNTDAEQAGKFFNTQLETVASKNPNARILVTRDQFGPKSATGTQVRIAQKGDMLTVKDAAKQGIKGDIVVPAKDAIEIKSGLGTQTTWKDAIAEEKGRSLAAQRNYGSIKNQYQSRIGKTGVGPEFQKVDEEMAALAPIAEAIKERGLSNRLSFPLHGFGSPLAIATGHTPGISALVYGAGKSLGRQSGSRDLVTQAIRSGYFRGQK